MSGDDDFDEFLARRQPLLPRPADEGIEPPDELDRVVLRKAREAIRPDAEPAYHGTRWGMPLALAASVLVVATIVLNLAWNPGDADVSLQNVAQRTEQEQARAQPQDAQLAARQVAPPPVPAAPPPPAPAAAGTEGAPEWRRDSRAWLAEIDRLRAAGRTAEADAEMAEFRRQNRAFAASPDR